MTHCSYDLCTEMLHFGCVYTDFITVHLSYMTRSFTYTCSFQTTPKKPSTLVVLGGRARAFKRPMLCTFAPERAGTLLRHRLVYAYTSVIHVCASSVLLVRRVFRAQGNITSSLELSALSVGPIVQRMVQRTHRLCACACTLTHAGCLLH